MIRFFTKNYPFWSYQVRFRRKQNCSHVITEVTENIRNENWSKTEAPIRTFMLHWSIKLSISYTLLLEKMYSYGFRVSVFNVLSHYSTDRVQLVGKNGNLVKHSFINAWRSIGLSPMFIFLSDLHQDLPWIVSRVKNSFIRWQYNYIKHCTEYITWNYYRHQRLRKCLLTKKLTVKV